jgi:glycosyltransferase involved in cell wall biosynthesis
MNAPEELPSVSVIIPCYNAHRWIDRAVNSALHQTHPDVDVIVIDDGSTDRTLEIIKLFGNQLHWETGPNRGACCARNRGLGLSSSKYVIFLDSDDYVDEHSIEHWARTARDTGADVVLGLFDYENDGIRVPGERPSLPATATSILCQWLYGWYTPPCAVIWRRAFLNSIGGWNISALRRQDGELMIRGLLSGANLAISAAGKGIYVQHNSINRISRRCGIPVLEWELQSLRELWELAKVRGKVSTRAAFSAAFYRLAYEAYSNRIDSVGQLALREARMLGLKGHVGSTTHRILAGIMGLRTKMLLTTSLRSYARSLLKVDKDGRV